MRTPKVQIIPPLRPADVRLSDFRLVRGEQIGTMGGLFKELTMKLNPSPSYSIDLSIESSLDRPALEKIITDAEGVPALSEGVAVLFHFVVNTRDSAHQQEILQALDAAEGTRVLSADEVTFRSHIGGKIAVTSKLDLSAKGALAIAYTPGVGRVCMSINEDVARADALTVKKIWSRLFPTAQQCSDSATSARKPVCR
jgi:hypothetical protein